MTTYPVRTMIKKDTKKLMGIVIDDNPSEEEKQWARYYLQFMMDRLDACDTDSQTSNTKGEV
jgi:hypothetical protein